MSTANQHFFDLAVKAIARQSSPGEQAELQALLAAHPELTEEFARLQTDARLAKEVLPLLVQTKPQSSELPGYARQRLRAKVRQTFRKRDSAAPTAAGTEHGALLRWWQWLGLAAAAAVVLLLALPQFTKPAPPLVQVAMLDTAGQTRGTATNPAVLLQQSWEESKIESFTAGAEVERWLKLWPSDTRRLVAKVVYDRDAGEVRVAGHSHGRLLFEKTFTVHQEEDLPGALKEAHSLIQQQSR